MSGALLNVIVATSQVTLPANSWTSEPNEERSTVPENVDPLTTTFAESPSGPVHSPDRSGGQLMIEIVRWTCAEGAWVASPGWFALTTQLPTLWKNRTPPISEHPVLDAAARTTPAGPMSSERGGSVRWGPPFVVSGELRSARAHVGVGRQGVARFVSLEVDALGMTDCLTQRGDLGVVARLHPDHGERSARPMAGSPVGLAQSRVAGRVLVAVEVDVGRLASRSLRVAGPVRPQGTLLHRDREATREDLAVLEVDAAGHKRRSQGKEVALGRTIPNPLD